MGVWIDRLTLSQRKLLFAFVAVGLIGLGLVSLRLSEPQRIGRAGARDPSASMHTAAGPVPPLTEQPMAVEGLDADKAQLTLPDDQIAAAQTVAERFCQEYATRRWDEPPSARLARLAPFVSDELAAAFTNSSGGAALKEERKAIREVTTAQPEFAYPQTISRHQVMFTVVVLQKVTTTQGVKEQRPSFQVTLEPQRGGWRVTNVVA